MEYKSKLNKRNKRLCEMEDEVKGKKAREKENQSTYFDLIMENKFPKSN